MQVLLSLFYMSPIITDNTPPFTFYIIIKINNFPLINSKISISKHYFLSNFSVFKYYFFQKVSVLKYYLQLLAIDETEVGYGNKIPLWMFGLLY